MKRNRRQFSGSEEFSGSSGGVQMIYSRESLCFLTLVVSIF